MTEQLAGQMSIFDLDIWCGKMYQEPLAQTKEKILEPCLKKPQKWPKGMPAFLDLRGGAGPQQDVSWVPGGPLPGEYMMHSFGEYPSAENASLLSQILEANPHPKYCLSAKACQGILRRAEKRGKKLPEMLEQALKRQAEQYNQPVCYGISSFDSNAMKSANPHSGIYEAETARTLDLNGGSPACNQGGMAVVSMATKQLSQNIGDNVAMPICANDYKEPQVVCLEGNGSRPSHRGDGYSESETMYTLNSTEHHAVAYNGSNGYDKLGTQKALNDMYVVQKQHGFVMQAIGEYKDCESASSLKQRDYKDATDLVVGSFYPQMKAESNCYTEEPASVTLVNGTNPGYQNGVVTYGLDRAAFNQGENAKYSFSVDEEKVGTCVAKGPNGVFASVVRRLTPMECERLQGFPDGWTNIGEWVDTKGKKHKDADSPRYKALGNSIAVGYANGKSGFWCWMAGRMVNQLRQAGVDKPTMASLFDGIGGFPLAYSAYGCKPVWASEIEEFPIAVTKIRFPENECGEAQNG